MVNACMLQLTCQMECSYDTARPAHLMFGHVSPPGVYHELKTLASMVERHDG